MTGVSARAALRRYVVTSDTSVPACLPAWPPLRGRRAIIRTSHKTPCGRRGILRDTARPHTIVSSRHNQRATRLALEARTLTSVAQADSPLRSYCHQSYHECPSRRKAPPVRHGLCLSRATRPTHTSGARRIPARFPF